MSALPKFDLTDWRQKSSCPECGVEFASPVIALRRQDGLSFCCPVGHTGLHYPKKDAEVELRRKLVNAEQRLQQEIQDNAWQRSQRETAERSAKISKTKLRKIRTRIKAGVCPECNRTFQQLARHMACKHQKESQ